MSEPSLQPLSSSAPMRPLWTLAGPGLGAMLAAGQFAVLLGLSQTLQLDLGFSTVVLAVAVLSHVAGAAAGIGLGFLLGRKAPTSVAAPGLVLMLIAAVVTALSGSSAILIVAGLVAGLGGGAVLGTAAGLSGQVGERKSQVRLALGLAVLGGAVAGLVIGWFIASALGWRLAYLLAVPMILAALVVTAAVGVAAAMRASR